MKAALFVLALCALLSFAAADIWSNCSPQGSHIQLQSVTINPDPPVKGQQVTVSFAGTLDEQVTGGSINVTVKYGFIPVLKQTDDICTIDPTYVTCPIPAGNYQQSHSFQVPDSIPSGSYSGQSWAVDQNGQPLLCVNFALKF